MIRQWQVILFLLVLLIPMHGAIAIEQIRFNPFGHVEETVPLATERRSAGKAVVPVKPTPAPWKPVLLATIVAGDKSLANVAGKLVRIGQKIDGYTLLSVNRKTATFEKSGHRYVLKLAARAKK